MLRFTRIDYKEDGQIIKGELSSFLLTTLKEFEQVKRRVYNNFGPLIKRLRGGKPSVVEPKAHGRTVLDVIST